MFRALSGTATGCVFLLLNHGTLTPTAHLTDRHREQRAISYPLESRRHQQYRWNPSRSAMVPEAPREWRSEGGTSPANRPHPQPDCGSAGQGEDASRIPRWRHLTTRRPKGKTRWPLGQRPGEAEENSRNTPKLHAVAARHTPRPRRRAPATTKQLRVGPVVRQGDLPVGPFISRSGVRHPGPAC